MMQHKKKYVVYLSKEPKEKVEREAKKADMSQGEWLDTFILNNDKKTYEDNSRIDEIAKKVQSIEAFLYNMSRDISVLKPKDKWLQFWK